MGCGASTVAETNDRKGGKGAAGSGNKNGSEPTNVKKSPANGGFSSVGPEDTSHIRDDTSDLSSISDHGEDVSENFKLARRHSVHATAAGVLDGNNGTADMAQMEETFLYDDIVIEKEVLTRNSSIKMTGGPGAGKGMMTGKMGKAGGNKKGNHGFVFNDFCVDELDGIADDESQSQTSDALPTPGDSTSTSRTTSASSTSVGTTGPTLSTRPPTPGGFSSTNTLGMKPGARVTPARRPGPSTGSSGPPEIASYDLRTVVGHTGRVKCIAIASGEREFVSSSNEDSAMAFQDIKTGRELGVYSQHHDPIISAAFSYCGKYLATTSRDNSMILWDVVTQKAILTFEHAKVVICCAFSRDSKYIATGCQDRICRVWETRKGKEVLAFASHDSIVISLTFSPDGTHVCSGAADKTVLVWSALRGKIKHTLKGHTGIILSCSYTNNGKYIISNDESSLRFWLAEEGVQHKVVLVSDIVRGCLATAPVGVKSGEPPNSKAALAAGAKKATWTLSCPAPGPLVQYAVVACNSRMVFVIDIATGQEVLHVCARAPVYCLSCGTNSLIAFGDANGNVYFLTLGVREKAWTNDEKAAYSRSRPKLLMS